MVLIWPDEIAGDKGAAVWSEPGSNRVLDFHGDPVQAQLVVYSDGNHHMALLDALHAFQEAFPAVGDIFYATTPPHPIVEILRRGALRMGNLTLSVQPHVFISPPAVMDRLASDGLVGAHHLLARNWGSVLLVPRHNEKTIHTVADLMRPDIRLFISNPDTETVSYTGYRDTLVGMAAAQGIDRGAYEQAVFGDTVVYGRCIHHREAPEAVASGNADAAIVFYHLALRYTRIFEDRFDFIPLGGTRQQPAPHPENRVSDTQIGQVGDGGQWGKRLIGFMMGDAVARIYARHGLRHRTDGAFA